MDDIFAMAEVQGIGYGENYLRDLTFISASMQVVFWVEFASFAIFHHNIEESRVIEDLVDFDDVWMFEKEEDFTLIHVDFEVVLADLLFIDAFDCEGRTILDVQCFTHFCKGTLP